jgi:hypothetical protein
MSSCDEEEYDYSTDGDVDMGSQSETGDDVWGDTTAGMDDHEDDRKMAAVTSSIYRGTTHCYAEFVL